MVNTELPFERVVKKSLVIISAGIPITITITNTNHKLTTSMKATKATNIQVRLLVEESQQLNSKKEKEDKFSANEMILTESKLYTKLQKKKCNGGEEEEETVE